MCAATEDVRGGDETLQHSNLEVGIITGTFK